MTALLLGREPDRDLGCAYTDRAPFDAVVIGSLTVKQLLTWDMEPALEALAQGQPVLLYTPGLPEAPKNRALAASLASARRQLAAWGVVLTDGTRRHLVTAQEARAMRASGARPAPGAVLTPLAKEILEKEL